MSGWTGFDRSLGTECPSGHANTGGADDGLQRRFLPYKEPAPDKGSNHTCKGEEAENDGGHIRNGVESGGIPQESDEYVEECHRQPDSGIT